MSDWHSVNVLASNRCEPGSIPNVGMWDGHWSPSQAGGFTPGTPVTSHMKFKLLIINRNETGCKIVISTDISFKYYRTITYVTWKYKDNN